MVRCTLIHQVVVLYHQHHRRLLGQHQYTLASASVGAQLVILECNHRCKEGMCGSFFFFYFMTVLFNTCGNIIFYNNNLAWNAFIFYVLLIIFFRLSTKSMLNLATKPVPGHVLKHGYVSFRFFLFIYII